MGSIFSAPKRPAPPPLEAESVASTNPAHGPDITSATDRIPTAQPPLKRRRVDPHNDPPPPPPPPPPKPTFAPRSAIAVPSVPAPSYDPARSLPHKRPSSLPVRPSTAVPDVSTSRKLLSSQGQQSPDGRFTARGVRPSPSTGNQSGGQPLVSRDVAGVREAQNVMKHAIPLRKRRFAIFLSYNGENYHGMQMNPGVVTIEQLIIDALRDVSLITEEDHQHPFHINFMRAARTDRGVSAAGQCVSLRMHETHMLKTNRPAVVALINEYLPSDVCVFGIQRATPIFNARSDCHRRRYEYVFPLRLLGGPNAPQHNTQNPHEIDPRLQRLSAILKQYEGTHCFSNFTDGVSPKSDASRRFMMNVNANNVILPMESGLHYVVVEVIGQSFLLHQIRKMVGLAICVYKGVVPTEAIPVALLPNVVFPTPKAPAEGLLLDSLFFDMYNKHQGKHLQDPIGDEIFDDLKQDFKQRKIYARIAEKERNDRVLESWFKSTPNGLKSREDVMELHKKFVLTQVGREEQRKAYVASLFPIRTSLAAFMDSDQSDSSYRMADSIQQQFKKRFGEEASFLARAPGRVILIGEHLDYNGFPVIGAAMKQGTIVAGCGDNTKEIVVAHTEDKVYSGGTFSLNGKLRSSDEKPVGDVELDRRWLQYVSWGISAMSKEVSDRRTVKGGGRVLIAGDLPRAGGLASSSSLVSLSVLMAVRLSRFRLPCETLASLAADGERAGAGTRGGSVDHTVSLCAKMGTVLEVSFLPRLQVRTLRWPEGVRMFAVDSRTRAEKGHDDRVRNLFNVRAAECRVAAAVLARRLGVHLWQSVTTPGQLFVQAAKTNGMNCVDVRTLQEMAEKVMTLEEVMSWEDVRAEMKLKETELQKRFIINAKTDTFAVGRRIAHVFTEAKRVQRFAGILSDESVQDTMKVQMLGNILNEGQESLQMLYESSIPTVDELVKRCLENGAVGSRMTGAGWGGYTVNLVEERKAQEFTKRMSAIVGPDGVLEISPWSGACVFAIHKKYGGERNPKGSSHR